MGFWHTGYIEFHEPTGFGSWRPEPTVYRCAHCNETFENTAALREHRFQAHPFKRPLLFIRGFEIGSTPVTITQAINPNDVETSACTAASVNGERIAIDQLAGMLASIEYDTVRIDLEGEGAKAAFEVRIEIASEEDLDGVERAFFDMVRYHRLDIRAIEQFIDSSSGYNTAERYCDGICEYLYGVLAKERALSSSLPFEAYREKFSRALDKLSTIDRPLANRIRALVEFHFNHFWEAVLLSPESRVGKTAARFHAWLSSKSIDHRDGRTNEADEKFEGILTDWDTEQLIRWAIRATSNILEEQTDIEKMLAKNPTEFDQTKLHMLLAEIGLSLTNQTLVLQHARELRNSPGLESWAENAISKCKSWGES